MGCHGLPLDRGCKCGGFGMQAGIATALTAFLAYKLFLSGADLHLLDQRSTRSSGLECVFAVAVGAGSLAGRLREVAEQARRRSRSLEILNAFAVDLSAAATAGAVAEALAATASSVTARPAVLLSSTLKASRHRGTPSAPPFATADWQAAGRCLASRTIIYPAAQGWPGQHYEFRPIVVRGACTSVLGLHRETLDDAIAVTLDAMIHQPKSPSSGSPLLRRRALAEKVCRRRASEIGASVRDFA